MVNFYHDPKQVVFADPDNPGAWLTGIAYKDEILCGCCGGVCSIEEVIKSAKENSVETPIYNYLYWNDLADTIVGGELPDGLEYNAVHDIVERDDEAGRIEDEEFAELVSKSFFD